MAEFQKVMQALNRMCYGRLCGKCPLHEATGGANCNVWMRVHFRDAEALIMQWAAEHPIKTNGMKFKEIFGMDVQWENIEGMKAWLDAEYGEGQNENQNN